MPSAKGVTNMFFGMLLGVNVRPFEAQGRLMPCSHNTRWYLMGRLDPNAHTPCFIFVPVLDFAFFLVLSPESFFSKNLGTSP